MCWLKELLDFWVPKPVEQDMDGDIPVDILESAPDSAAHLWEVDILGDIPETYRLDTGTAEGVDEYLRFIARVRR